MDRDFSPRKSALILSHPGHELRVLGWIRKFRPVMVVLTNGAGHGTISRIELTRKLVEASGGTPAEIFGRWSDQQIYQAVLNRNVDFFLAVAKEVGGILAEEGIEIVVGDSIEGYNPSHDLCRHLIQKSLAYLPAKQLRHLENYEFPLVGHPAVWSSRAGSVCHRLTTTDRLQKQADILAYAQAVGGTLLAEVEAALERFGSAILGEEWLSPVSDAELRSRFLLHPPEYEKYGQKQVEAGHYRQVIRYYEHLLPLCNALRDRRAA